MPPPWIFYWFWDLTTLWTLNNWMNKNSLRCARWRVDPFMAFYTYFVRFVATHSFRFALGVFVGNAVHVSVWMRVFMVCPPATSTAIPRGATVESVHAGHDHKWSESVLICLSCKGFMAPTAASAQSKVSELVFVFVSVCMMLLLFFLQLRQFLSRIICSSGEKRIQSLYISRWNYCTLKRLKGTSIGVIFLQNEQNHERSSRR